MPVRRLRSVDEIGDFIRGNLFLGGLGIWPAREAALWLEELKKTGCVGWKDASQIADDALTLSLFPYKVINTTSTDASFSPYTFSCMSDAFARVFHAVEKSLDRCVDALIPMGICYEYTVCVIAASSMLGIPCVDGSYTGSASLDPMLAKSQLEKWERWSGKILDETGNIITPCKKNNPKPIECTGRPTGWYGLAMEGGEMKRALSGGNLSDCYSVGSQIRCLNEAGLDVVSELVNRSKHYLIMRGILSYKKKENRFGKSYLVLTMYGNGVFLGNCYRLWLWDSQFALLHDDLLIAASPDCIALVEAGSGEPCDITSLRIGDEISIIGW